MTGSSITGDGLRAFRDEYGITQEGFASLAGIAVMTVRNFETSRRAPRRQTLVRICEAIDEIINSELVQWAKQQTCGCGYTGLRIQYRLTVKPVGTFSLAGHGMKFSATHLPWLVCPGCDAEAQGRFE